MIPLSLCSNVHCLIQTTMDFQNQETVCSVAPFCCVLWASEVIGSSRKQNKIMTGNWRSNLTLNWFIPLYVREHCLAPQQYFGTSVLSLPKDRSNRGTIESRSSFARCRPWVAWNDWKLRAGNHPQQDNNFQGCSSTSTIIRYFMNWRCHLEERLVQPSSQILGKIDCNSPSDVCCKHWPFHQSSMVLSVAVLLVTGWWKGKRGFW